MFHQELLLRGSVPRPYQGGVSSDTILMAGEKNKFVNVSVCMEGLERSSIGILALPFRPLYKNVSLLFLSQF